jgi:type IV pilus assembly protein PilA
MKTLQKGFSLVELLVVVAIIGVLAGVGIVGYQGYTDSAKERVAVANLNSVKRFIDTELTLLNNNIQTSSASINAYSTNCAGSTTSYNNVSDDLEAFLKGVACYFAINDGYGNAFKNPYKPVQSQVQYAGVAIDPPATDNTIAKEKGTISIEAIDAAETIGGMTFVTADVTASDLATQGGKFRIVYYSGDTNNDAAIGTDGEVKGKSWILE